ncbi:nuclear transport factor 2 family protein [Kribbella sp. NPDC003505]|uniref:nuclear transport factor 2 family protein n=1 Tax=Kribbella sp. NPDC003505 TaxID=3154448 RepID=UPI0033B9FAAB
MRASTRTAVRVEAPAMYEFQAAIEARNLEAALTLMDEDVVFHSPVLFRECRGRAAVAPVLYAIAGVLENFRYTSELRSDDGADHALMFKAEASGLELDGCDLITVNDSGKIAEFTMMIRPLGAVTALALAMVSLLPRSSIRATG